MPVGHVLLDSTAAGHVRAVGHVHGKTSQRKGPGVGAGTACRTPRASRRPRLAEEGHGPEPEAVPVTRAQPPSQALVSVSSCRAGPGCQCQRPQSGPRRGRGRGSQ
eukprot:270425-Rhodomonas_salina.1